MPDEQKDNLKDGLSSANVKEFLRLAQERFKLAAEAEMEARSQSLDDLAFSIGEQWPKDIQADRNNDGRPCLTINRLPQFIHNVVNEYRQQRPAAQINPVGDGADVDTAQILGGVVRHVETNSDAEIADDHAFDCMTRIGFGYERIITEKVDDETGEQEIYIKRIKDPFTVYMMPGCDEPDDSDAEWAFIVADLSPEEYKSKYNTSTMASWADASSIGDNSPGWATKNYIRVAEYFYCVGKGKKRKVKWALINAIEILDETDWPGKYIPIISMRGDDFYVNGKRHIAGMVRHAKDPQRMFNYWESAATEAIALAPKAPFVAAEGQLEGREEEWRQANRRNLAVLQYKPVGIGGQTAPPPQRNQVEPPIQAMSFMLKQAAEDLQATTGINDANLGKARPDESGKAVLARQKQGDLATLHFSDNAARSIRYRTRQLLDLFPKVYDTARIQRIIMPDGDVKQVVLYNGKSQSQQAQGMLSDKIKKAIDISVGRYDVTVSVGPSYQSKRQEAVASELELLKSLPPQAAMNVMDLIVKNMDWPGAQAIADRFKKMLPPQMQADDDTDPKAKVQILQAQLQQMSQQHELLTKTVNELTETLKSKQIEQQGKLDIEKLNADVKIAIAEIQTKAQDAKMRFEWEQEVWRMTHDFGMQKDQQAHEKDLAAQAAANQSAQSAQDAAQAANNGTGGAQ